VQEEKRGLAVGPVEEERKWLMHKKKCNYGSILLNLSTGKDFTVGPPLENLNSHVERKGEKTCKYGKKLPGDQQQQTRT